MKMNKLETELFSNGLVNALEDLKECEASSQYTVDMTYFHLPATVGNPTCRVCLAGAVMAKELDFDPLESGGPSLFDRKTNNKLTALDMIREGLVLRALVKWTGMSRSNAETQLANANIPFSMVIPGYDVDPDGFKETLFHIADALADAGF